MGSLSRSTDHPDSRAIFYNEVTYRLEKEANLSFSLLRKLFEKAENVCALDVN